MSFPIYGKPSGILLSVHTQDVRDELANILASRPFPVYKYALQTGENLLSLTDEAARWHDAGKLHVKWQEACRKDYVLFEKTGKLYAPNLRKGTVRHEFASLVEMSKEVNTEWLPESVYAAIAAHHGKLGYYHEKRWQDDILFLEWKKKFWLLGSLYLKEDNLTKAFEAAVLGRYQFDGVRSLLRLADQRASIIEDAGSKPKTNKRIVPKLEKFRYNYPWDEYRGVQKKIFELWDKPFSLLRAPTGAGKTDAALLWAQRQVSCGRADRLVWVMPTRFTSNALFISTPDKLSNTGIYHSSAWHIASRTAEKEGNNPDKAHWQQELDYARLLETPTTITTIDQLCMALTGSREDHHATYWNLAHSCLVIDESDFYDDFTQRNIVVLLRVLRILKVPVLIMSATLPKSAIQLYALAGFNIDTIYEDTTGANDTRLELFHAGKAELPEDIAYLLERALNGEALIIYANTVARAQDYWDWFQKRNAKNVVLYHSRFTEPDKEKVEKKLLDMLGPDAWQKGHPFGIAILTQIGELSVNISANLMVSDLCPTDRLAQRAGRLSRFEQNKKKEVGELHLVNPLKRNIKGEVLSYPAPYGQPDGKGAWIETEVLKTSKNQLQEGFYSPNIFVNLVNDLYPELQEETTEVRRNRMLLQKAFINNWLLLPKASKNKDEDENDVGWQEWKSRDIPPQRTVYVNADSDCIDFPIVENPQVFRNFFAFREWALPKSISISVSDFEKAKKEAKIYSTDILVNDEDERIWIVRTPYYNENEGLRFTKSDEE